MNIDLNNLPDDKEKLKEIIAKTLQEKANAINKLEKENQFLKDQIALFKRQTFGSKSEKLTGEALKQSLLFNEAEYAATKDPPKKQTTVKSYTRTAGRKPLPNYLPRKEIIHDIPENQKTCSCGNELTYIGDDTNEELELIPAKVEVIRHIKRKYACKKCEGTSDESKPAVITAKTPPKLLPGTMATPSILSYLITGKFCDALPYYRQSQIISRIKVDISRGTMCNWTIKAAEQLEPFRKLLLQELLTTNMLAIDETSVQVLKEKGKKPQSKSFMWVFLGGNRGHPLIYYHYSPSRGAPVLDPFLENYNGIILSDAYQAYKVAEKKYSLKHANCHAHARRYFYNAAEDGKNKLAAEYLKLYEKLFAIERKARNQDYSLDKLLKIRRKKSKPLLDKMEKWLKDKTEIMPGSLLGKAINYSLDNWKGLILFLDHPEVHIDNNLVENAIRPFAVGRKNWLFADTVDGVNASAFFYSVIESAKANGLEPYRYLIYLFENFPKAQSEVDLKKMLPNNVKPEQIELD